MEVERGERGAWLILDENEVLRIREVLDKREKLNVQLDRLDFDLNVLRILVNAQRMRLPRAPSKPNDEGFRTMGKILGISDSAAREFCHGHSIPSLKVTVRMMAWVGYTDMGEFLTEE